MKPHVCYLPEGMTRPSRCYNGIIVAFAKEGQVEVQIEDQIFKDRVVHIINETELYRIHSREVLIFSFPRDCILKHSQYHNSIKFDVNLNYQLEVKRDLIALFKQLINERPDDQEIDTLIFKILRNFHTQAKNSSTPKQDLFNEITSYIFAQLKQKITLNDLAQKYYISRSYVSNLFTKRLNMTFNDYLCSLRVAHTMTDLLSRERTVEEIARQWGYTSASKYIGHFKRFLRTTPKQYLQNVHTYAHLPILDGIHDICRLRDLHFGVVNCYVETTVSIKDTEFQSEGLNFFQIISVETFRQLNKIVNNSSSFNVSLTEQPRFTYVHIKEPLIDSEDVQNSVIECLKKQVPLAINIRSVEEYLRLDNWIKEFQMYEIRGYSYTQWENANLLIIINGEGNILPKDFKVLPQRINGVRVKYAVDITSQYVGYLNSSEYEEIETDYYLFNFSLAMPQDEDSCRLCSKEKERLNDFLKAIKAQGKLIVLDSGIIEQSATLDYRTYLNMWVELNDYLSGVSIHFSSQVTTGLALINQYDIKLPFAHLHEMLGLFVQAPIQYGENYIVAKKAYGYLILLYNYTSPRLSESLASTHFTIQLDDLATAGTQTISLETVDMNPLTGLEGVATQNVKSPECLSPSLKYKVNTYTQSTLTIDAHEFLNRPYFVTLKPNMITLCTIYHSWVGS
ncbi:helix-turn-helix domain-containing protein [Staphylococcus sp. SQ8-PEA]|uniref:Helix-turn-helix domain-containing protein n=1 Tax=Staphylococcus marylandisciuri TaxID=2981529 RepID=A0ABT2QRM7_9STAP|nr:helix-turn-helix domain-containing protein [Staphylococcus marylandisciuri]MCU5746640.1 helix-turn-helix domain-containing protein [Staphylococcus marylandisciuri]